MNKLKHAEDFYMTLMALGEHNHTYVNWIDVIKNDSYGNDLGFMFSTVVFGCHVVIHVNSYYEEVGAVYVTSPDHYNKVSDYNIKFKLPESTNQQDFLIKFIKEFSTSGERYQFEEGSLPRKRKDKNR